MARGLLLLFSTATLLAACEGASAPSPTHQERWPELDRGYCCGGP